MHFSKKCITCLRYNRALILLKLLTKTGLLKTLLQKSASSSNDTSKYVVVACIVLNSKVYSMPKYVLIYPHITISKV